MKQLLQSLGLLLCGLAAGLLAVELLSRLIYTRPWYEQLVAEQVVNGEWSAGIHLNRFGLRDKDYATVKPPNTRRVLILGDSFTFGSGLADDDAVFARLLDRQLNAGPAGSSHIEVMNGGMPGSLSTDWAELLQKVKGPFQPDVILVVFFLRDGTRTDSLGSFFGPIRDEIIAQNQKSPLYQASYVYRFYQDFVDQRTISQKYTRAINDSYTGDSQQTAEWRTAQFNLRMINAIGEEIHARVGLVIFPVLADLNANYPFKPTIDAIAKFSAQDEIPTLSLLPAFMGRNGPDLWVSPFNQHPNAAGHQIAAGAILPFLRKLLAEKVSRNIFALPRTPAYFKNSSTNFAAAH
jgi:lysophospholipase L1-like esterase